MTPALFISRRGSIATKSVTTSAEAFSTSCWRTKKGISIFWKPNLVFTKRSGHRITVSSTPSPPARRNKRQCNLTENLWIRGPIWPLFPFAGLVQPLGGKRRQVVEMRKQRLGGKAAQSLALGTKGDQCHPDASRSGGLAVGFGIANQEGARHLAARGLDRCGIRAWVGLAHRQRIGADQSGETITDTKFAQQGFGQRGGFVGADREL